MKKREEIFGCCIRVGTLEIVGAVLVGLATYAESFLLLSLVTKQVPVWLVVRYRCGFCAHVANTALMCSHVFLQLPSDQAHCLLGGNCVCNNVLEPKGTKCGFRCLDGCGLDCCMAW